MTKHRLIKRRSQKGGYGEYADSNVSSLWSNITSSVSKLMTKAKESGSSLLNNVNSSIGNAGQEVKNMGSSLTSSLSKELTMSGSPDSNVSKNPSNYTSTTPNQYSSTSSVKSGGKRRRSSRSMRGGKSGLGLTYYAAPVSGLKVAEPTTWLYYANGTNQYTVKGGSRKQRGRKNGKTRRNKKI
jgi:hypothetical protein